MHRRPRLRLKTTKGFWGRFALLCIARRLAVRASASMNGDAASARSVAARESACTQLYSVSIALVVVINVSV